MVRRKATLTHKQKIKVLLIEIDYHLMCLFDAMKEENKRAALAEKRILLDKQQRLEALGYYDSSSEERGI